MSRSMALCCARSMSTKPCSEVVRRSALVATQQQPCPHRANPPTAPRWKTNRRNDLQVTLLGAMSPVGRACALALKANRLVSRLTLHDTEDPAPLAEDLQGLPSPCRVYSYHGITSLPEAIKWSELVVQAGGELWRPGISCDALITLNGGEVRTAAETVAAVSKKALLVVCTPPINSCVPLAAKVFDSAGLNPQQVVGCVGALDSAVRTVTASELSLPPDSVHVPLVGGACLRTVVPLLSRAGLFTLAPQALEVAVREGVMKAAETVSGRDQSGCPCWWPAHATVRTVLTLVAALAGYPQELHAHIYQPGVISTLDFVTTRVFVGPDGVDRASTLPHISRTELLLLDQVLPTIYEEVRAAYRFIDPNSNLIAPL